MPTYFILDTTTIQGRYLLFTDNTTTVLIGQNKTQHHRTILQQTLELLRQHTIPRFQEPTLTATLQGAGLYQINHEQKTIEFFGHSLAFFYVPLGPLQEITQDLKEKTGLDLIINEKRHTF